MSTVVGVGEVTGENEVGARWRCGRDVVRWGQTWLPAWVQEGWLDARQAGERWLKTPHEREFLALEGMGLPSDAVVLDLGANRGQSIDAVRMFVPGARITAVEPSGRLAARLAARYPGVDVVQAAVGAEVGNMRLHTPSYRGYRFDGLAAGSEEDAMSWFPTAMLGYSRRHVRVERERVVVTTVDSLDVHPDFVKIDVQGMELAVLHGARRVLAIDMPVLMIEAPTVEVCTFLAGFGYTPRWSVGAAGTLSAVSPGWALNVFFVPS